MGLTSRPGQGKKPFNPFYVMLLIVGTVFAITACAYGVMTVQLMQLGQMPPTGFGELGAPMAFPTSGNSLIEFLDAHGFQLMMWELGLLAVATVAAIGTDEFWTYRASLAANKLSPGKNED